MNQTQRAAQEHALRSSGAFAGRESAAQETWYPIASPPPRRVEVRLTGNGGYVVTGWLDLRMLQSVRVAWWFERVGRLMAPLERVLPQPTGRRSPVAWQPLDASAWPYALPDAAQWPAFGPRWAPPRAPVIVPEEPPADARSPLDRFEARLLNAWRVDRALPDADRAKLRVRSQWPETRPGPGDYPPEQITRYRPTREDVADYLVVMAFIARLTRAERRVLRLKADGWGFLAIAHVLRQREGIDQDDRHVRRLYRTAVRTARGHARAAGAA